MFFKKDTITQTKELLIELGAAKLPHVKSGSLQDHLLRVAGILEKWGLDHDIVLAGMTHSLYATEFFKNGLIDVADRGVLQNVIGKKSENLVYIFCTMQRSSLRRIEDNSWLYVSRFTQDTIPLDHSTARDLLHILLANEIDHMSAVYMNEGFARLRWLYSQHRGIFCPAAESFLSDFCTDEIKELKKESFVRFVAHAGIQIKTKGVSVIVDPWIYPSTHRQPLIQGLNPSQTTIDYLIPEPVNSIMEIASDIILLSHFHTHHAPLREVRELVERGARHIVSPSLSKEKLDKIKENLGTNLYEKIIFYFPENDSELSILGVTIKVFTHTHLRHFIYYIKTEETSVLHIADAGVVTVDSHVKKDDFLPFQKLFGLAPDYLFISAAGHSIRLLDQYGNRDISENNTFSPLQAAKLTTKIAPTFVGVIGIYNFSIWDQRTEYTRSVADIQGEFIWALSYLVPRIKILDLKPGAVFDLIDVVA